MGLGEGGGKGRKEVMEDSRSPGKMETVHKGGQMGKSGLLTVPFPTTTPIKPVFITKVRLPCPHLDNLPSS